GWASWRCAPDLETYHSRGATGAEPRPEAPSRWAQRFSCDGGRRENTVGHPTDGGLGREISSAPETTKFGSSFLRQGAPARTARIAPPSERFVIICVLSNTMDLNGRKTMNFTHAGLPFVLAALAAGARTQAPNQSGSTSGGSSKLDDDDSASGDDGKPDPADDDEGVDTSGPGDTSAPNDDDEDPTNAGTTIQPPRLDVAPITTLEGGNTTETCADANVV